MRILLMLSFFAWLTSCADKPPPLDVTARIGSDHVSLSIKSSASTKVVATPRWDPPAAVHSTTSADGTATLDVHLKGMGDGTGSIIVSAGKASAEVRFDPPAHLTWRNQSHGAGFDCGEPELCSGVVAEGLTLLVNAKRPLEITWLGTKQKIDGKGEITVALVPQLQGLDLSDVYAPSGAFKREHAFKLEYDNVTLETTATLDAGDYRRAVYAWARRANTRGVTLEGEPAPPPGKPRAVLLMYEWEGTSRLVGTAHALSDIDLVLFATKSSDLVSCGTYVATDGRTVDLSVTSGNISAALYRRRDGEFVAEKDITASGRCPDRTLATLEYGMAIGGGVDPSTEPLERWARSFLARK